MKKIAQISFIFTILYSMSSVAGGGASIGWCTTFGDPRVYIDLNTTPDDKLDPELFAISSGFIIGSTWSISNNGYYLGVWPRYKFKRVISANIFIAEGDRKISVPVNISFLRIGAFGELFRGTDRIQMNFSNLKNKKIKNLLGTYVGMDVGALMIYGNYRAAAININGVTLRHTNSGLDNAYTHPQGAIGLGVAVPIIRVTPDYSIIAKESSFWDQIISK